ncbi:MAG: ECF transporter S component [Candidatus Methanomethylicaceae archaeon]
MVEMRSGLPRVKKITYTAIVISLAVTLRLIKYQLFGPIQFINFPAVFTIVGGALFGPSSGLVVGIASYLLSDIIILPGPWTLVNSTLMGGVGALSGLLWGMNSQRTISKLGLGVGTYLMLLAFDITNSWALFALIGFDWVSALWIGIIGLFLPAAGGFMYAVGPITEATTAILVVTIVTILKRNGLSINRV